MNSRTFEAGDAFRERSRLDIAIMGPSGSGKTKSALRLADGIARVNGGDTWLIDTNNRRSLHHAPKPGESHVPGVNHRFKVLHMPPPYGPADWGAAFERCIREGARRIIADSFSDEWEGEGGILDMHEAELDRRAGSDFDKRDRMNQAAWIVPKREHKRLRLWMFQQPVDWIITFRAQEKSKPAKGKGIEELGMQPVGAQDVIFELLLKCLLPAQADGKPVWNPEVIHERKLVKLPGWFRDLFASSPQLSEDLGEQLARWAAGGDVAAPSPTPTSTPADRPDFAARLDACRSRAEIDAVERDIKAAWPRVPAAARKVIEAAGARANARYPRARASGAPADAGHGDRPPTPEEEAALDAQ